MGCDEFHCFKNRMHTGNTEIEKSYKNHHDMMINQPWRQAKSVTVKQVSCVT